MNARPYQQEAEDAAFSAWEAGDRKVLIVMPTGTGKTVLFASISARRLRQFPQAKVMVIAHREELIFQARDKIKRVAGLEAAIEMGDLKAEVDRDLLRPTSQVVVATVQTLTAGGDGLGRISKFSPFDFCLLVIDEAHHATSASYRRVVEHFLQNPDLVVVGVTATPDRADEEALGQVFDVVAYDYEIKDAIEDGWLVPIRQQLVSIASLDIESVRTTAGDLNGADLAAVMEEEENMQGIVSSTIDIVGDRRGIGFAASVDQARVASSIFNRHRPGMSAWVCGKTEDLERKRIVDAFTRGEIQWLWNCGVYTEGFDADVVEVIAMARPTKSRALYAQMAGRATRPLNSIASKLNGMPAPVIRRMAIARSSKPSCLIIDFVGNSGKHKLMTTADILGGKVSDEAVEAAVARARRAGGPVRMDELLEEEERRIKEMEKRRLADEARKANLTKKAAYTLQNIDPFDVFQIKPEKPRGWDQGKKLPEGRRRILREKLGVDPDKIEFRQGVQLVTEYFRRLENNLCTLKQCNRLKKFGVDGKELAYNQARAALDAIAATGWRRLPDGFQMPPPEARVPRPGQDPAPETPPAAGGPEDDNVPF